MDYNPFSLKGKTILITGASSGIGRATAIECSRMGASVIIAGRNIQRLEETQSLLEGEGHKMAVFDVLDKNSLTRFIDEISTIDGVVFSAGIVKISPLTFANEEKIKEIFDTNFFATVELLRLLVKKKRINKEGSVVAIASIGGNFRFKTGNAMYGSSKAALVSAMKYFAVELAPKGIRVNSICPGMVETPMLSASTMNNEQLADDIASFPLKRYGRPEEVAYACVYFLSDAAKWVTGTTFIIDGGVSI